MSIYKVLSILAEYPTQEVRDNLFAIRQHAVASGALDEVAIRDFDSFLAYLGSIDLIELQAEYVQTFDLTPEHSLHLTHHIFGDDKNRGPALIDLGEQYKRLGLEIDANELPDYLPLILEFCHAAPSAEAAEFLADTGKVLRTLAGNLDRAKSPWLPLFTTILHVAGLEGPLVPPETECSPVADCAATCSAGME
jgi:nitrate reductase delta subunit